MIRARPGFAAPRGLLVSLALAALLAAVPLPRLGTAVHDPAKSGAGMGTRVPLLLETGARLGAPSTSAGAVRLPALPGAGTALRPPYRRGHNAPVLDAGQPALAVRLVSLGRLQLEGG